MNLTFDGLSMLVTCGSLVVSVVAVTHAHRVSRSAHMAKHRRDQADAADRAASRFARFNEILFEHDEFQVVFSAHLKDLKDKPNARLFLWYVINQMEAVYIDYNLGQLSKEAFEAYDRWFQFRLGKNTAMREFLQHSNYRPYFIKAFQKYYDGIIALEKRHMSLPGEEGHACPYQ